MYAVISAGGKQYRVEPGTTFLVEKLPGEAGSSVTIDQVLLVSDGDDIRVGTPTVPGASVTLTVLGEQAGEKVIIFKYKQKARYRRRTGHRQHYTQLRVDGITLDGKERQPEAAAKPKPEAAAKRKPEAATDGDAAKKAPRKAAAADEAAATDEAPPKKAAAPRKAATAKKAAADEVTPKKKAAPKKAAATKKPGTKGGSD